MQELLKPWLVSYVVAVGCLSNPSLEIPISLEADAYAFFTYCQIILRLPSLRGMEADGSRAANSLHARSCGPNQISHPSLVPRRVWKSRPRTYRVIEPRMRLMTLLWRTSVGNNSYGAPGSELIPGSVGMT